VLNALRGRPNLSGYITAGASTIEWKLGLKVDRDKTKGWSTTGLWLSAPQVALQDLAALLPIPLEATGPLDLAVDVQGTDGVKDATGTASVKGQNLVISAISFPGMEGMDLGQEIPIDNLDIELEVKD
jgi:hypothetical protein